MASGSGHGDGALTAAGSFELDEGVDMTDAADAIVVLDTNEDVPATATATAAAAAPSFTVENHPGLKWLDL